MFEQDGKLIIEWKAGGDGVDLVENGLSADILSALVVASGGEIKKFSLPEKLLQNLRTFLGAVHEQVLFRSTKTQSETMVFMDDTMTVD